MATSSLDRWRDYLSDLNFWLDGYRRTETYGKLRRKMCGRAHGHVHWNVGVGPAASFTRAIASIALESLTERRGPFDPVIKVDLTEEEKAQGIRGHSMSVEHLLVVAVAKELGLLDQKYSALKEEDDELLYYTYARDESDDAIESLERHLSESIVAQINSKLSTMKYLLVVENLEKPIRLRSFYMVGLPPQELRCSELVISTTYPDVKPGDDDDVYRSFTDDEILMIILSALHQSARYIFNTIRQEDEQYWHRVALRCFHYAMLLFPQRSPPHGNGDHQSCSAPSVTSDELICQWAAQGIVASNKPSVQESDDDIYHIGNVILQAFRRYSLMKLPFSPATADAHTETAAQFLAYHRLIPERLQVTVHKLLDDKEYLEQFKWISFMDDQGWHSSWEWLNQETGGPTALILRHCSQISNLLPNLPCLRVLDLSYTPLESLPFSVWCIPNLRLLSLRGCHGLRSLCSLSDSDGTASQKYINLLYLDLSYSDINTFRSDFFQSMPNLQELLLVECSNLVELPPSIAALSSLTTLELTGTQIKSFPDEIFSGMQHLQTLKLVDNKLLMSLPRSISEAQGLKELHVLGCNELREAEVFGGASLKAVFLSGAMQWLGLPKSLMEEASHGCFEELHIKGWESTMVEEIKLDGHPTLRSFLLIAAPHIRRLSLRGCIKLESVEFKDLGALEELDLSATAIKELPADIPNLPQLRKLLLMGVPCLRRFPWHALQRFPDVFCLNHCVEGIGDHSDQVAQVRVSDSRLFHSFSHMVFKSFYVRVAPCMVKIRRVEDAEDMVAKKLQELVLKKSPYTAVYYHYMAEVVNSMALMVTPHIRQTECHVEMIATDQYPHGLNNLLEVTKSITMTDDTFVSCLNDLSDLDSLEECKLRWCHQMKQVFDREAYMGDTLQNAWASYMKSLIHFYIPSRDSYAWNFSSLKHLRLEYCPRLEDIMPCGSALPRLTTLDILFCYNLKTIFHGPGDGEDSDQLPCLQRIRLQELPQLKHLRDDNADITAPEWKELHVRGCWSLRRLPRLRQVQELASKVEVSGERAWWAKLRWDEPRHGVSYEPKLSPAFASLDKCAEVMSYLR